MSTLEIIFTVLGAVLGFVAINWVVIAAFSRKVGNISERVAVSGDKISEIMEDFGMVKTSLVIKEGADIADELGDLSILFADLVADNNLSADDLKKLFTEGKEGLWVEMKDFRIKVFPKD